MKRKIEEKLLSWKNNSHNRMPLLVYGARQVGKTYSLIDFGKTYYDNIVYVNLETNLAIANYFNDNIDPDRIIRFLEVEVNQQIIPESTLIIFDEIQSCERALTSLKYFTELAPQYHIVAAGSLLGVAINRSHFSFPVGKVESITLYPLDFEEFLWANNEERLAQAISEAFLKLDPLPDSLHQKAIELYRSYLIVGGMPASVNSFKENKSFMLVPSVQSEIVNNYIADMAKYASASEAVKIRSCFNSIPAQLAKENRKFQYKVIQKGGSAALFGASIDWLEQAGLVVKCQKIEQAINPISVYTDLSSFKLYMGDVGLLVMKSGISLQSILTAEPTPFMGAITENYIAQQLLCNDNKLYYWTSEHSAELDFVIQIENNIVGIEVKKGLRTHSKSLHIFNQKYNPSYSIRFSEKNFGKSEQVVAIPLYAAYCLKK